MENKKPASAMNGIKIHNNKRTNPEIITKIWNKNPTIIKTILMMKPTILENAFETNVLKNPPRSNPFG